MLRDDASEFHLNVIPWPAGSNYTLHSHLVGSVDELVHDTSIFAVTCSRGPGFEDGRPKIGLNKGWTNLPIAGHITQSEKMSSETMSAVSTAKKMQLARIPRLKMLRIRCGVVSTCRTFMAVDRLSRMYSKNWPWC